MGEHMDKRIKQFSGANMDIDLTSDEADIDWKQSACPWNEAEKQRNINVPLRTPPFANTFAESNIWTLCFAVSLMQTLMCYQKKSANHNFRFTEKIFSASHENGKR